MNHFDFTFIYEHHRTFIAGQSIFEAGDPGDAMYILLEGQIHIKIDDLIIDELEDGAIFGEMALVDAQTRSASAIAFTDCKLMKIDEERFGELASQIPQFGIAVMRIMSERTRRLIIEETARQRMVQELAIGQDIQRGLLPEKTPEVEGWEFAAVYLTATQVGGDFYDFIVNPDHPNNMQVVVADVTGKGVPAAIFMASMRSTVRTLAHQSNTPADILRQSNRAVMEDIRTPLFLSCLIANLNLKTGDMTLSNAGHDWPLWVRAAENVVETVEMPGFVLGMFKEISPEQHQLQMQPGDFMVIFTDGVTEARNSAGQFFDDDRLLATIQANQNGSADELAAKIVEDIDQFAHGQPRSDDLTLVVIKRQLK